MIFAMNRLYTVIFTLIFAVFSMGSHAADLFTVKGIDASGTSDNAKESKKIALKNGEREALYKLFDRITPQYVQNSLPKLDDEQISELVRGFDVKDEKITRNFYKANLSISFNPLFIGRLLEESGISYIKKKSKPVIILPVLYQDGTATIWQPSNLWKNAWQEAIENSHLVNFIIPKGDADDRWNLDLKAIAKGDVDYEKLQNIITKYNADKVLLASLKYDEEGRTLAEVSMSYIDEERPEKLYRTFYAKDDETFDMILSRATDGIVSSIERIWKKQQENTQSAKIKINVTVPIRSLSEWVVVNKKLSSLDFITKMDVSQITTRYAIIDLYFNDSYESFNDRLNDEGLTIKNNGNGLFLVDNDAS